MNEAQFCYKKPSFIPVKILLLTIVSAFFALFTIHSYDEVISTSLITCNKTCQLSIEQLANTENDYEYIIIDNKKYSIETITFAEPYFNELYQDVVQKINIEFSSDSNKYHNQVEKIKLLYNRQRTIKKIIEKII